MTRDERPEMNARRHALLGAAALGVAGLTGVAFLRESRELPPTRPIPSAPGFRRMDTGAPLSSGGLATLGLDGVGDGEPGAATADAAAPLSQADLCAALFPEQGPGVPVAAFTDYRCPTCPALAGRLAGLGGPPLAISWHEWPVLGPQSVFAARVALAAAAQGGHAEMHDHLMRNGLRPSVEGARSAAAAVGLDPDRLAADLGDPRIDRRLALSGRLARQFGLRGTPTVIFGGTAIEGLPSAALLRRVARTAEGPCRR